MNGYVGRILRVDLTRGEAKDEPLNEAWARDYVGGSALAARYIYGLVDGSTDALSAANPLALFTGPFVGTIMPSAGRYSAAALSPLTGLLGEANSGGFFGPELRYAGYDGLIVEGKASSPTWLSIVDGRATLHDAAQLVGLDTYQTQQMIRRALGDEKARVACIGVAGEKLARMAAIMNDHGRAAGRTGLGAVMGSKNLKAIAVRGSAQVPLARAKELRTIVRDIAVALKDDVAAQSMRMAGTASWVDIALMYGDMPIRYFQQGQWDEGSALSGVLMTEQYLNRSVACFRCPIACGRETRAPAYGLDKVDGPEYETLGALGSLLMINDLQAVIYAGHLCNFYGLDTISVGGTLGLVCELFERGILSADQTGGLDIRYGDAAMMLRLIEMIAQREGFGDVLAEGSVAVAERYGAPDLAVAVNRLEVPMHEPRAFCSMAAIYALSPRGACHMEGDMYCVDTGQGPAFELGIEPGDRFDNSEDRGRVAARHQAWRNLYNALILCQFQNPGVEPLRAALNAITGWDLGNDDLMVLGKRMLGLKRELNLKRGLTRADERLPLLLRQPLADGGTEGTVPDLDALLRGAYAELDWDLETGRPTTAAPATGV